MLFRFQIFGLFPNILRLMAQPVVVWTSVPCTFEDSLYSVAVRWGIPEVTSVKQILADGAVFSVLTDSVTSVGSWERGAVLLSYLLLICVFFLWLCQLVFLGNSINKFLRFIYLKELQSEIFHLLIHSPDDHINLLWGQSQETGASFTWVAVVLTL